MQRQGCEHCGKPLGKHANRFCSNRCQGQKASQEGFELWLSDGVLRSTRRVRAYLLEEAEHECSVCHLGKWQGQPIPLEIDHIDGDPGNNWKSNLRVLCLNCHGQTPTYRFRSRGQEVKLDERNVARRSRYRDPPLPKVPKEPHKCACGQVVGKAGTRCWTCHKVSVPTKAMWPQIDVLCSMVQASSYEKVGRDLGVTGAAVHKRINGGAPGWKKKFKKDMLA